MYTIDVEALDALCDDGVCCRSSKVWRIFSDSFGWLLSSIISILMVYVLDAVFRVDVADDMIDNIRISVA